MPTSKKQLIILGIDPGLATTGFGLIKTKGQQVKHIKCGTIDTPAKTELSKRLVTIFKKTNELIKKYRPDIVAVEDLFFCKNVKTALQVGHARGVVLLAAEQNKLPAYEYTPLQVKQAITSYGRAEKSQVQEMVKIILNLKTIPKPDDAADALAVAITCAHSL